MARVLEAFLSFFFFFTLIVCVLEGGASVGGAHVCAQEHMHETEDSF